MARDQKDHYYRKAKQEGYRARSAFKLLQINEKFHLIRKGDSVVDLGAAPGGWLQVAKELSEGKIVGVDLEGIAPMPGITTFRADITQESTVDLVKEAIGGSADVVICDAAPNLSGAWDKDHALSIDLARSALKMARKGQGLPGRHVPELSGGGETRFFFCPGPFSSRFKKGERRDLSYRQAPPYGSGAPGGCHGCADRFRRAVWRWCSHDRKLRDHRQEIKSWRQASCKDTGG